ncbi:hypothetical protein [Dongia sp. agr-C8]
MLRILGALILSGLLTACASSFPSPYDAPEGKVLIVRGVEWKEFETYLSMIGNTRPGAFVMHVTNGQTDEFNYSLCEYDSCYGGPAYANGAMNRCRKRGGGECVMFADNRDILVNYRIAEQP